MAAPLMERLRRTAEITASVSLIPTGTVISRIPQALFELLGRITSYSVILPIHLTVVVCRKTKTSRENATRFRTPKPPRTPNLPTRDYRFSSTSTSTTKKNEGILNGLNFPLLHDEGATTDISFSPSITSSAAAKHSSSNTSVATLVEQTSPSKGTVGVDLITTDPAKQHGTTVPDSVWPTLNPTKSRRLRRILAHAKYREEHGLQPGEFKSRPPKKIKTPKDDKENTRENVRETDNKDVRNVDNESKMKEKDVKEENSDQVCPDVAQGGNEGIQLGATEVRNKSGEEDVMGYDNRSVEDDVVEEDKESVWEHAMEEDNRSVWEYAMEDDNEGVWEHFMQDDNESVEDDVTEVDTKDDIRDAEDYVGNSECIEDDVKEDGKGGVEDDATDNDKEVVQADTTEDDNELVQVGITEGDYEPVQVDVTENKTEDNVWEDDKEQSDLREDSEDHAENAAKAAPEITPPAQQHTLLEPTIMVPSLVRGWPPVMISKPGIIIDELDAIDVRIMELEYEYFLASAKKTRKLRVI